MQRMRVHMQSFKPGMILIIIMFYNIQFILLVMMRMIVEAVMCYLIMTLDVLERVVQGINPHLLCALRFGLSLYGNLSSPYNYRKMMLRLFGLRLQKPHLILQLLLH